MSEASWTLIESEPAIFSSLLSSLGVNGVQCEEVFSLDAADLDSLVTKIYGFIFLFKHVGNAAGGQQGVQREPKKPHYFAHQVITNACATLALLNATLNIDDPAVTLGEDLSNLKSFSLDLDPQSRGWAIAGSENIRLVHNSFARPDPFPSEETRPATEDDDVYHFVTYVPIDDELYEFDGLKQLPVCHGPWRTGGGGATGDAGREWTKKAQEVIQARIDTYQAGELMFNLMAICGDRAQHFQSRIDALSQPGAERQPGEPGLDSLVIRLEDELDKRRQWETDNAIRRHNHVGLVHALLVSLARTGELNGAKEAAKEKYKQRQELQKTLKEKGIRKGIMDED